MNKSLRRRDRAIYGIILPIGLMVIALFLLMNVSSLASAAEFGGMAVMFGGIIATPIVLIINLVVAAQDTASAAECFKRGMIAPGVVILVAILYQAGIVDAIF